MKALPQIGSRVGRWTVVAASPTSGPRAWICVCDCGTVRSVVTQSLRTEASKSCGCWKREVVGRLKAATTHGLSKLPEYGAWTRMRMRCTNPKYKGYHRYGGRGITVCERWNKFENFYADMGSRPSPEYSIDRIDNDGDYDPSNCRWATAQEQARNRHTSRILTLGTKSQPACAWADELGMSRGGFHHRLASQTLSLHDALTQAPSEIHRRSKRREARQ